MTRPRARARLRAVPELATTEAPTPSPVASSSRAALAQLLLVLAVFALAAFAAQARHTVAWNSDSAMVGLMARDIVHGAHPVFFDGSEYGGTLEQHWVALAFALFGESVAVHRAAVAVLLAGVVALAWAATRLAFGDRAALAAGLYLAAAPHFFFYRGLASEGPYAPVYLCGAGILFFLLLAEHRSRQGRSVGTSLAAMCFVAGVGWWTHPLSMAFGACALAALAVGTARRKLSLGVVAGMVAAFALGSLPWWIRNVQTGWMSLTGSDVERAGPDHVREQVRVLFDAGIPTIVGARAVWRHASAFPGAAAIGWALLAVVAGWGLHLVRSRRAEMSGYAAAVLLPLLVVCPLLALNSARTNFTEARLLVPYYLVIAPLFGALVASPRVPRALRAGAVAAALALAVGSHATAESAEQPAVTLVQQLRDRGVRRLYASYWKAYQVTFLSGGTIVGTPFGASPTTRRLRDADLVGADASPAVLLGPDESPGLDSWLAASGAPVRREMLDGGFVLYRDLPPRALAEMRACLCVPKGAP